MSIMKRVRSFISMATSIALLSTVTPAAFADDSAIAAASASATETSSATTWLQRMHTAFSQSNYDGVFSFVSGTDVASLRIVHMYENGVQSERLVHLDGAPREIVRKGEEVLCILGPDDELLALGSSIPSGPFAQAFVRNFEDVGRNYHLTMGAEDRVAGRATVRMTVKPKDQHRYGYRLWLDKETGLLLRSDLVDELNKRPLEVFQFNQILVGANVESPALESEHSHGAVIHHFEHAEHKDDDAHHEKAHTERKDLWHATWLPAGFEMAAIDIRRAAETSEAEATDKVKTIMYTDGLAAISIFIEELTDGDEKMEKMVSLLGATASATDVIQGPKGTNHVITVVGEIPPKTASNIAASVKFGN